MSTFDLVNVTITGNLVDISTTGQVFIPVTEETQGEVIEIRYGINGPVAISDVILTAKINDVAMTDGTITVPSASIAGDIFVARPTGNRTVAVGEAIEIETDGASTGTFPVSITLTIRR